MIYCTTLSFELWNRELISTLLKVMYLFPDTSHLFKTQIQPCFVIKGSLILMVIGNTHLLFHLFLALKVSKRRDNLPPEPFVT